MTRSTQGTSPLLPPQPPWTSSRHRRLRVCQPPLRSCGSMSPSRRCPSSAPDLACPRPSASPATGTATLPTASSTCVRTTMTVDRLGRPSASLAWASKSWLVGATGVSKGARGRQRRSPGAVGAQQDAGGGELKGADGGEHADARGQQRGRELSSSAPAGNSTADASASLTWLPLPPRPTPLLTAGQQPPLPRLAAPSPQHSPRRTYSNLLASALDPPARGTAAVVAGARRNGRSRRRCRRRNG